MPLHASGTRRLSLPCPRLWRAALWALLLLGSAPLWAETVRFPGGDRSEDRRWDFVLAVLELSLGKTAAAGSTDTVMRLPAQMQARRISELLADNLDVAVAIGSKDLQDGPTLFLPIPLQRGMLGWRLLLVNKAVAPRLAQVRTLEQLRPLRLGYPRAFADYGIMEAAGFNIVYAGGYESLFRMLELGRLDWVSRGVGEVFAELDALERRGVSGIVMDPSLALRYKADWFFIVNPRKPELARRIQQGLELAMRDGSYDRLFDGYFGAILAAARLEQRRIIELDNPDFPELGKSLPADWLWQPPRPPRRGGTR
jgi:hypothetical protein